MDTPRTTENRQTQDLRVYTTKEVALILKYCTATVKKLIRLGKLKHFKEGRSVRITGVMLDQYISDRSHVPFANEDEEGDILNGNGEHRADVEGNGIYQ